MKLCYRWYSRNMITIIQDSHFLPSITRNDVYLMIHIANDQMLIISTLILVCIPSCAKISYPSISFFEKYIHTLFAITIPSCLAVVWNSSFQLQRLVVLVEIKQSNKTIVSSGDQHITVGGPVAASDRIAMFNGLQRLHLGIPFIPHA